MKKILTSFLALAAVSLTALSGYSQTITIEGVEGTTYAGLEEAMNAASDGATILLSGEYTLPTLLKISKNITIKGADETAVIKRENAGALMFLDNAGNHLTLSNLTIDGAGLTSSKAVMECSNNADNRLENVKIINAINTANSGLVQVKSNGGIHINGLTVENSSVPEGKGHVFVGKSSVKLSGDNSFTTFCEKDFRVEVEGDLTNKVPLVLYVDPVNRASNKALVLYSKDPSKFYVPKEMDGVLAPKTTDNEMYFCKKADITDYERAYVRHIFLNEIGYHTFESALAAALPGETIEINGEVEMDNVRSYLKDVTIKGTADNAKLIRNAKLNNLMWIIEGGVTLENLAIDGNVENTSDRVLIELKGGDNAFKNVKLVNVAKADAISCLVQVKQGCRALALENVVIENCGAAYAKGAIKIDENCGADVTLSGLDDLTFEVGGKRFITLAEGFNTESKIGLFVDYTADSKRQDGTPLVKGTTDINAVTFDKYLEADVENNQLVYYAVKPFEFLTVNDEMLHSDHNFISYVAGSGKHEAGEYVIDLKDAKFFNLPVENLKAAIAADEDVWDLKEANRWNGVVPESVAAGDAEAYHAANHWRYYQAEVVEVSDSKLTFKAAQAGRYLLTLTVDPESYESVKGERSKTYAIEVVPTLNLDGFTDHGVAEGVTADKKYSKEAIDNLKIYVLGADNKETIVAVHEQNAGWALTDSKDVDLTKCFVATKYGDGNLSYMPEAVVEDEGVEENVNAAPAFRSVSLDGYVSAADGIDLSAAKSLNLIQKVNGVYSDPMIVNFAAERVPTGVEDIEAAEENAEAEYFTLEGIRVEAPLAPGAYVCRRGAKAGVIMVK